MYPNSESKILNSMSRSFQDPQDAPKRPPRPPRCLQEPQDWGDSPVLKPKLACFALLHGLMCQELPRRVRAAVHRRSHLEILRLLMRRIPVKIFVQIQGNFRPTEERNSDIFFARFGWPSSDIQRSGLNGTRSIFGHMGPGPTGSRALLHKQID